MHAHVNYMNSEHTYLGYTLFHISAHLKKQYNGWMEYRSEGAIIHVVVLRCGHL